MKRWISAILCVLLLFSLTGCSVLQQAYGRVSEMLWSIQKMVSDREQPESQPTARPEPRWVELEAYDLMKEGFSPFVDALEEWLRQGLQENENLTWNLHTLDLTLGTDGMPLDLQADLYAYQDGRFVQGYVMEWDAETGRLHQAENDAGTPMESGAESSADIAENPNLRLDVVADRLRELPQSDLQMALGTPLLVEFTAFSRPQAGQTIVDMTAAPVGFDLAMYQAGQYGKADGSPAWTVNVRRAEDEDPAGTRTARFCFAPADASCWLGDPDLYAQTDIRVTGEGHLFYTRDWGENWNALPSRYEGLLSECIDTCTAVTRSSWYVSPQPDGPVGFVLGGELPVVVYSLDGGATWQEQNLGSYPHKPDRRVLCGGADGSLYAAAGCEWSMGAGGKTELFWCAPGGNGFEPLALPTQLDGHYPICGMAVGDGGEIVLSVETSSENNWPDLYMTLDRGETWQSLDLPWEDAGADGVGFLYRVSSLQKQENGDWLLCLTQEPTGVNGTNWCALFSAPELEGPWTYLGKQPDRSGR